MKAKKIKEFNRLAKNAIRQRVEKKLIDSLEEFKRDLGQQRFMKMIRKTSKEFARKISGSVELNTGSSQIPVQTAS
jgi:hypothetical protein